MRKKPAPQDATRRNVQAANKKIAGLLKRMAQAEARLSVLEKRR